MSPPMIQRLCRCDGAVSAAGLGCRDAPCCLRCRAVLHGSVRCGEMPVAPDTCALVFKAQADGSGVGTDVAAAVSQLVRFAPIDVDTKKSGTTMSEDGTRLPAGHDSADFITAVTALDGTAPSMPSGLKAPTAVGDHFTGVTPGSTPRALRSRAGTTSPGRCHAAGLSRQAARAGQAPAPSWKIARFIPSCPPPSTS